MAWQQRTEGTSGLIFSCGQHRKGLLLLGGGRQEQREREIRSPDVYSLYTVSKGFGNKVGKKPSTYCATKSDVCKESTFIQDGGCVMCYVTLSKTNQLD